METVPLKINRKLKYYYAHKDEPEFQQRMKEAKQRYYEKNKERLIQKALDRYYKLKEVNSVPYCSKV